MASNMSYKAIEKEVLHNSNKDCFATYGFGEPVHIHDNTTEHQGMRATLCLYKGPHSLPMIARVSANTENSSSELSLPSCRGQG